MALDRFSKFEKGKKPPIKQIRRALEEYIGDGGKVQSGKELNEGSDEKCNPDNDDWFFATLPGKLSFPFLSEEDQEDGERWFEVCCISESENIDVITRQSDSFTNAVAEGFAELIAGRWEGERW